MPHQQHISTVAAYALIVVAVGVLRVSALADTVERKTAVYRSDHDDCHPFQIPPIVRATTEVRLAFAEERKDATLAPADANSSPKAPQGTAQRRVPKPANFVTREQWGSKPDPIPKERRHTPRWITLHHAGVLWTNSQDPAQFVRNMQAWGKKRPQLEQPPRDTYWPDLPYHFLIAPDGRIFEGRPIEFEPESNTKYSLAGNIGVEMMGDFDRQRPSPAQLESAVRLAAWLMQEHRIAVDNVRSHRDLAPGQTACPGRDFYRYLQDGQLKQWIRAVQSSQPLRIDPGPPLDDGPTELITETRPPTK